MAEVPLGLHPQPAPDDDKDVALQKTLADMQDCIIHAKELRQKGSESALLTLQEDVNTVFNPACAASEHPEAAQLLLAKYEDTKAAIQEQLAALRCGEERDDNGEAGRGVGSVGAASERAACDSSRHARQPSHTRSNSYGSSSMGGAPSSEWWPEVPSAATGMWPGLSGFNTAAAAAAAVYSDQQLRAGSGDGGRGAAMTPSGSATSSGSVLAPRSSIGNSVGAQQAQQAQQQQVPLLQPDSFVLHDIELDHRIGEGGFGIVWKARIRHTGKLIAVKILKVSELSEDMRITFDKEANLQQSLRHPNIARCLAVLEHPLCMVMEYATKGNLRNVLETALELGRPLGWEVCTSLALDVARGLAFLHTESVIHRDIKSANILVFRDKRNATGMVAKITDFGLAKIRLEVEQMTCKDLRRGTAAWQPPEAFSDNQPRTSKSDVYSFGMVLFEIVSGRMPFHDKDQFQVIGALLNGERPMVPDGCPEALSRIIKACWSQSPQHRPTMQQVCTLLEEAHTELFVGPRPDATGTPWASAVALRGPGVQDIIPEGEEEEGGESAERVDAQQQGLPGVVTAPVAAVGPSSAAAAQLAGGSGCSASEGPDEQEGVHGKSMLSAVESFRFTRLAAPDSFGGSMGARSGNRAFGSSGGDGGGASGGGGGGGDAAADDERASGRGSSVSGAPLAAALRPREAVFVDKVSRLLDRELSLRPPEPPMPNARQQPNSAASAPAAVTTAKAPGIDRLTISTSIAADGGNGTEACAVGGDGGGAAGGDADESAGPWELMCPLSKEIMNDPVTLESGETFERSAILRHFQEHGRVCPIKKVQVSGTLVPNLSVRNCISYCREGGYQRISRAPSRAPSTPGHGSSRGAASPEVPPASPVSHASHPGSCLSYRTAQGGGGSTLQGGFGSTGWAEPAAGGHATPGGFAAGVTSSTTSSGTLSYYTGATMAAATVGPAMPPLQQQQQQQQRWWSAGGSAHSSSPLASSGPLSVADSVAAATAAAAAAAVTASGRKPAVYWSEEEDVRKQSTHLHVPARLASGVSTTSSCSRGLGRTLGFNGREASGSGAASGRLQFPGVLCNPTIAPAGSISAPARSSSAFSPALSPAQLSMESSREPGLAAMEVGMAVPLAATFDDVVSWTNRLKRGDDQFLSAAALLARLTLLPANGGGSSGLLPSNGGGSSGGSRAKVWLMGCDPAPLLKVAKDARKACPVRAVAMDCVGGFGLSGHCDALLNKGAVAALATHLAECGQPTCRRSALRALHCLAEACFPHPPAAPAQDLLDAEQASAQGGVGAGTEACASGGSGSVNGAGSMRPQTSMPSGKLTKKAKKIFGLGIFGGGGGAMGRVLEAEGGICAVVAALQDERQLDGGEGGAAAAANAQRRQGGSCCANMALDLLLEAARRGAVSKISKAGSVAVAVPLLGGAHEPRVQLKALLLLRCLTAPWVDSIKEGLRARNASDAVEAGVIPHLAAMLLQHEYNASLPALAARMLAACAEFDEHRDAVLDSNCLEQLLILVERGGPARGPCVALLRLMASESSGDVAAAMLEEAPDLAPVLLALLEPSAGAEQACMEDALDCLQLLIRKASAYHRQDLATTHGATRSVVALAQQLLYSGEQRGDGGACTRMITHLAMLFEDLAGCRAEPYAGAVDRSGASGSTSAIGDGGGGGGLLLLSVKGGMDCLVKMIAGQTPQCSAAATRALSQLLGDELGVQAAHAAGVVPKLVQLLGSGDAGCREASALALAQVAVVDDLRHSIVEAGAVGSLVSLLATPQKQQQQWPQAWGTSLAAVRCLALLSTVEDAREQLATGRGLPPLVRMLDCHPSSAARHALDALYQVATSGNHLAELAAAFPVPALARLLKLEQQKPSAEGKRAMSDSAEGRRAMADSVEGRCPMSDSAEGRRVMADLARGTRPMADSAKGLHDMTDLAEGKRATIDTFTTAAAATDCSTGSGGGGYSQRGGAGGGGLSYRADAVHVLRCLSREQGPRRAVVADALPLLVDVAGDTSLPLEERADAAEAIKEAAREERYHAVLESAGAVRLLVRLLGERAWKRRGTAVSALLDVTRSSAANQHEAVACGAVCQLAIVLSQRQTNTGPGMPPETVKAATEALGSLLQLHDARKQAVAKPDLMAALVGQLGETHLPWLQHATAGALRNLAYGNVAGVRELTSAGALPALVLLVEAAPSTLPPAPPPPLQLDPSAASVNPTRSSTSTSPAMGVVAAAAAAAAVLGNCALNQAGCAAVVGAGALPALLRVLASRPGPVAPRAAELLHSAWYALQQLARCGSPEVRTELLTSADASLGPLLCDALAAPEHDWESARHAATCLRELAGHASLELTVDCPVAVDRLCRLLVQQQQPPAEVQAEAAAALAALVQRSEVSRRGAAEAAQDVVAAAKRLLCSGGGGGGGGSNGGATPRACIEAAATLLWCLGEGNPKVLSLLSRDKQLVRSLARLSEDSSPGGAVTARHAAALQRLLGAGAVAENRHLHQQRHAA